jgi:predicted transposase/invertase (TIGR01784 family)
MRIRIDPRVDFAFKLMLGSPLHTAVTVHFLNALLRPRVPIVSVEILNPLVGKDRSEDKIIVLDVLARDALGRMFNIEIQTRIPLSFPSRLLYYNSKNYLRQITEGDSYEKLCPAISICLLDRHMFDQPSEGDRWYHSFRLRCDQNAELVLTDNFEFHIFELPKFQPTSDNIGELPANEKWLYLLTHAVDVEPDILAEQLGEPAYREAIGVLEMISKSPEDLQYYEDRLKFLRDERGKLDAAREEGREEGRQEGKLAGMVQTLQEILGDQVSTDEVLLASSVAVLTTQLQLLRDRLNKRNA